MSAKISDLIPELQDAAQQLLSVASQNRLQPRVTSTLRTRAQQERLYRRYLSGLQPYYVAPPGTSPHEWGYAFDMVVSPMDYLADLGQLWESWGGYWGGHQADPVHFQYPGFKQYKKEHPSPPGAHPSAELGLLPYFPGFAILNWATGGRAEEAVATYLSSAPGKVITTAAGLFTPFTVDVIQWYLEWARQSG